jgi:hypothetical protein
MTLRSAVTIIAARFDHALRRGEDASPPPAGAALSAAGTETDWNTEDGLPRRERRVRVWMAIWQGLDAARSFADARSDDIPILATATGTVALVGVPFACHGDLNWSPDGTVATLYPGQSQRPDGTQPIPVMTILGIGDPGDGLVEFGRGVAAVRAGFAKNPAVLLDINMLPDLPMIDGPTLTVWRSEQDVVAGAYRSEPHRSAMNIRNGATARASFTRMAIVAAEGSWNGRDISNALRAGA